jgi:uncharacterized protein (TIGR03435 family)
MLSARPGHHSVELRPAVPMRHLVFAVILTLLTGTMFAPAPASASAGASPLPSFEVASVKPNAGATGNGGGGRGAPDPTQLNYTNIPLKLILQRAFDAKDYQIVGPSWLQDFQSSRFDIRAKGAPGTTKEQIPLMLQNLLVERFGMKFHMEKRELPAYELVVAKGGVKMKESAKPVDEPLSPDSAPNSQGRGGIATQRGQDGRVELAPGRKGAMVMGMGGALRISARLQSSAEIATLCQNRIGRPVADKTGLTGTYDFNLDFSPNGQTSGAAAPSSASGTPLGDLKDDVPPFEVAIQSLGLKLQPAKVMIDVVVIDHIEKVPTEN